MAKNTAGRPFQVLADCPRCKVEGAVVELIEPGVETGRVLESRCRMCGRRVEDDRCLDEGRAFQRPDEVLEALSRWAEKEGEADLEAFVEANFGDLGLDGVAAELIAGRPVSTAFDAVAWLFPGSALGTAFGARSDDDDEVDDVIPPRKSASFGVRDDPGRVAARALIAVMVGDGKIRPEERAFIDRFLSEFGYQPISDFDIRPWRPGELGRPEDPEGLVEAMARLVYVDRERDGSEWRIVREFARAWGYPMERLAVIEQELDKEYAPRVKRFWMSVRRIFIKETTW